MDCSTSATAGKPVVELQSFCVPIYYTRIRLRLLFSRPSHTVSLFHSVPSRSLFYRPSVLFLIIIIIMIIFTTNYARSIRITTCSGDGVDEQVVVRRGRAAYRWTRRRQEQYTRAKRTCAYVVV